MSATSREIARILAIAGRPAELRTLAAVAADLGVSEAGSVREAVDAGVVVLGDGEGVWFRHPLLAGGAGRVVPARRGGAGTRGVGGSPGVGLRRGCRGAAPAR